MVLRLEERVEALEAERQELLGAQQAQRAQQAAP